MPFWPMSPSSRHQCMPICSALSIEQTRSLIWIVRSSTLASETRMSPATTRPLSSTRSSTSTRLTDRLSMMLALARLCMTTPTRKSKRDVLFSQPERLPERAEPLVQAHQRDAQPLDLVVREIAGVDAPHGLTLEHFTDELDDRKHQPRQTLLDALGLELETLRRHPHVRAHDPSPSQAAANVYAGQGPLQRAATPSGSVRSMPDARAVARNAATSSRARRKATCPPSASTMRSAAPPTAARARSAMPSSSARSTTA